MKHVAWVLGILALGCGIGGRSPSTNFYVLYPHEGRALEGPALRVELRRPGLPDYLERPQIVRRVENGRLELSETERWGASLTKMVSSTLAKNLSRQLPQSEVYTESGGISADPDVRIEVELQQFELSADENVELSAQVALHWKTDDVETVLKRFELQEEPASGSTAAVVAAMSDLLGELSEAIAQLIAAGPQPQAPETVGDDATASAHRQAAPTAGAPP